MTVDTLVLYLKEKLAPNVKSDLGKHIIDFIDSLISEGDISSLRLLACMGIDIKNSIKSYNSENPSVNTVIKTLQDCIELATNINITLKTHPNQLPSRYKFALAQKSFSPSPYSPCIKCIKNEKYTRIYQFRSFIQYVVDLNQDVNKLSYDKTDINELDRYEIMYDNKTKFNKLNITTLGYNRWVFIANNEELLSLGYTNNAAIIDGMGLYSDDTSIGLKFVTLEYDENFNEDTFQPDTLTGDWGDYDGIKISDGNHYYLSYYSKDEYGRTFSTTGSKTSFKERVHRPFNHNGSKIYLMKSENLGQLTKNLVKASDIDILTEALYRFLQS